MRNIGSIESVQSRYWDSACFLKYLKKETDYEKCAGVICKAEEGDVRIITSALTIAEVIYLKPNDKIDRKKSDDICKFFENEYIVIVNIDRKIAELARNLLWDYKALRPGDAIHIASAIKAKVDVFDTFDDYLINLSGAISVPPLLIRKPDIPYQVILIEEEKRKKADTN